MSDQDDFDATRVSAPERVRKLARDEGVRPYLIVLAGSGVGRMFRLPEGHTIIGRSRRADIRIDDDSISRMHVRVSLSGDDASIEDLQSSNGTVVNGAQIRRSPLRDGDKIRLGEATILKFSLHDRLDESFQRKMYDAALRDALTGVYNKKHFLDQLAIEASYARRQGTPLSLVLFDVDHFKQINDNHGHLAGDRVLEQLAALLTPMLRAEDVFARYGGEEFAVLLRGAAAVDAATLAERLRGAVADAEFHTGSAAIRVTISVGVAEYRGDDDPLALVAEADGALYSAKNGGRNRVVTARP